jgi:hypothetical protein
VASYRARIFGTPKYWAAFKRAMLATVAAQPPGFGEFPGGAFGHAFEGIGRGEAGADERVCRIGVARLFEPDLRHQAGQVRRLDMAGLSTTSYR